MRNVLLRTTSIAILGFGLTAAPMAFAQDSTTPAVTPTAPVTGTAPDPNSTIPGKVDNKAVGTSAGMTATDGAMGADADRVTIVGGTQPMGTVLATDLQGEPVKNASGEDLATLDDFVFDEHGRIVGAVVSFGGFLGLGEKSVLLPWEELTIDGDNAEVMLSMTEEQIDALPEFEEREDVANRSTTAPVSTTTAPAQPAPVTQ